MFIFLAGKIQGVPPFKFLSKKVPGETLCKFFPISPPKDLAYFVIVRSKFFDVNKRNKRRQQV